MNFKWRFSCLHRISPDYISKLHQISSEVNYKRIFILCVRTAFWFPIFKWRKCHHSGRPWVVVVNLQSKPTIKVKDICTNCFRQLLSCVSRHRSIWSSLPCVDNLNIVSVESLEPNLHFKSVSLFQQFLKSFLAEVSHPMSLPT